MDTHMGFTGGSLVKNLPIMQELQETQVQSLGEEDPLEEGKATHSSILAWRRSWTEEPNGLRSVGSQEWDTTEVTEHRLGNPLAIQRLGLSAVTAEGQGSIPG